MADQSDKDFRRIMPKSDLDLQMMLTEPQWGKLTAIAGAEDQLNRNVTKKYKAGESVEIKGQVYQFDKDTVFVDKESIWSVLNAIFVRDLRLGRLDKKELRMVRHYLDLAHDSLQLGFPTACVTAMARVAAIVEPSQSKQGWLRRLFNTLRHEKVESGFEPKKKNLLGKKREG